MTSTLSVSETRSKTSVVGKYLANHLNDCRKWRCLETEIESYLKAPGPPETIEDLPCTSCEVGTVFYHIHGIVHGGSLLQRPTERVRTFVQGTVKKYAEPAGLSCLCEERFSRYWGLHLNLDIDDIARTPSATREVEHLVENSSAWCRPANPDAAASRGRISRLVGQAVGCALRDERHISLVRRVYEALPYPAILEDDADGIAELFIDLLRSRYMAEYMTSYAALSGISTLHAVVGLGHEREVQHFILHPTAGIEECVIALAGQQTS